MFKDMQKGLLLQLEMVSNKRRCVLPKVKDKRRFDVE